MSYFTISLLWYLFSLLTINATSIHYKSQHFSSNNPSLWSSTTTPSNEIISCTIAIPSLCLYILPNTPGFHLFYGNKMFDFLHDTNWSKVIVTNNLDNEQYNNVILQLMESNITYEYQQKYQYIPIEMPPETPMEMPDMEMEMEMDEQIYDNDNNTRRRLRSGSYSWRGCYKDAGRRAFRYGPHRFHYSINKCYRACKRYRYFALQAGSWCSCENSWAHATKYGRGRGCRRSHTGGGWRNDVFAIRRRRKRRRSRRGRRRRGRRRRGRRRKRKSKQRWHPCNMKCKLNKALSKLRRKYKRESREAKMRGRVYNRLYRFGKLLGESMRTGNFGGVCGLTGECDMGYGGRRRGGMGMRGSGCGANRMNRCPTRFATYLGPPHIVGKVSYILGSPPVGTTPSGWSNGQSFGGMGGGLGTSPMYPGMMGGMNGMQAPGMYPGMMGGFNGNQQKMIGNMGYNKKKEKDKKSKDEKKKKIRRRLMNNIQDIKIYNNIIDIRLKKCVYINDKKIEEICAVYYYNDGSVQLEYNTAKNHKNIGKNNVEYYEGNVWKYEWNNGIECNSDLLDYIGYILCISGSGNDKNNIKVLLIDDFDIDDNVIKSIDLMDDMTNWNEIYQIHDGMKGHKKICEYINGIELCFEMMKYNNNRKIEITTERMLSKNVNVIGDNIKKLEM